MLEKCLYVFNIPDKKKQKKKTNKKNKTKQKKNKKQTHTVKLIKFSERPQVL